VQVGDLVGHRFENGLGVILKVPRQTGLRDYLVHFTNERKPRWYREKYLEVISASR